MEFSSPQQWIHALWVLFGFYWLVSALKRKKTKRRETWGERFVPLNPAVEWAGVLLTAAGVAVAFWARWHLGANWSGVVTLKEGHELIRTGPYRNIRHPIYTGILLALFGTVVVTGELRGLLAVAIAWLSFYWKARREESFLSQEFGEKFAAHAKQTGMFLPKFANG